MSGKVHLSRATASDAGDLIACNVANREHHRPWTEPFTDESGFAAWLARSGSDSHASLVARESANGIVGVINFSEIVRGVFQSAYTGFYGMSAFAGRGLMTEALKAAVTYAFTELELHRLEANIRPENTRSLALVQRAGFRKEGFSPNYLYLDGAWRDHERWAITRENVGSTGLFPEQKRLPHPP